MNANRPNTTTNDPIPALMHARWVDALARRLVSDPGLAADLGQETRICALTRAPDPSRPLRGWLATVMRNLMRQARREDERRGRREHSAAVGEATPSCEELACRLEAHRAVVDAVSQLDEPYRRTILLRYFEDLTPTVIADREGVPVATVKTRLQRGLKQLRARLDRSYGGDSRAWAMTVMSLAPRAEATSLFSLGALVVNVKLALTSAVLLLGAAAWYVSSSPPDPTAPPSGPAAAQASGSRNPTPADATPGEATRRAAAAETPAQPDDDGPTATKTGTVDDVEPSAPRILRGVVLDANATRVPGQSLAVLPPSRGEVKSTPPAERALVTLTARDDGSFELPAPDGWERIVSADPAVATVLAATRSSNDPELLTVVVARAVEYGGIVVDEAARPIAGIPVKLALPDGFRGRFSTVLDAAHFAPPKAVSGDDGRFVIASAPQVDGATLGAVELGFEPSTIPAPAYSASDLRLVMRRPSVAEGRVQGVVIDQDSSVVSGALVSLRGEVTRTDDEGRFVLDLDDTAWTARLADRYQASNEEVDEYLASAGLGAKSALGARLVAVKRGHQPGVYEASSDADGPMFPSFVVLQLGPPPLAIEGRVLGPDGAPVKDARVWVDDPTTFGLSVEDGPMSVEGMAGGGEGWTPAVTDEDGRFRVDGLHRRSYRLVAMDGDLLRTRRDGVGAGATGIVLRFEAGRVHGVVHGRVVTLSGRAVAGASVRAQNDAFSFGGGTHHGTGESTTTDDDGGFTLHRVPKEGVYLRIDGEGIVPMEYARALPRLEDADSRPVSDLVVRVTARCHIQLDSSTTADSFGVVDEKGEPLPIDLFSGNSRRTTMRFELVDGRSPVVAVSEEAAAVVLFRDGTELRRVQFTPEPGVVTTVRP